MGRRVILRPGASNLWPAGWALGLFIRTMLVLLVSYVGAAHADLICRTNAGECVIPVEEFVGEGGAVLLCDGMVVAEKTIAPTVCAIAGRELSAPAALCVLKGAVGLPCEICPDD